MPNEKEVKTGAAGPLCSVTGRRCACGDSGRCQSRLGDGRLDTPPAEAVRWTKASMLKLELAAQDLDLSIHALHGRRAFPSPEYREAQRLIDCAKRLLKETCE